jgi:hypothetical protein
MALADFLPFYFSHPTSESYRQRGCRALQLIVEVEVRGREAAYEEETLAGLIVLAGGSRLRR